MRASSWFESAKVCALDARRALAHHPRANAAAPAAIVPTQAGALAAPSSVILLSSFRLLELGLLPVLAAVQLARKCFVSRPESRATVAS